MWKKLTATMAGLVLAGSLSVAFAAEGEQGGQRGAGREGRGAGRGPQWRLGVQAYSFNRFTFFEAVDKAKEVGVRYIEAYPGQKIGGDHKDVGFDENMSPEVREAVKKKLQEARIRLVNYGVTGLSKDEKAARKTFEFAKDMGIETIVSEPEIDALEVLDKLAEEYKINVALHNHPKPSRYWDPQTVLDALKGRSKRVGACADTGHWVRSGLDPVECLKKLEGRIISLHFKDLNKKGGDAHDVVWGTGVADVKAMLTELKRQNFAGVFSIEYEHNWDNSVPEIAECVKAFHKIAQELGVRTGAGRRPAAG